jgi:hypothetical protein
LANPGNFTGSIWTVTDGSIVTPSTTTLTIPDYPISNNLVSLTVGISLGIAAGDFAIIADPTGRNTMFGYVLSYASTTGALMMQTGVAFEFEIRSIDQHHHNTSGFTPFFNVGVVDQSEALITAQNGNGITIVDIGIIQILIPVTRLQILHEKTYGACLTNTRQSFIGRLPVLYGGVHRTPIPVAPALVPGVLLEGGGPLLLE